MLNVTLPSRRRAFTPTRDLTGTYAWRNAYCAVQVYSSKITLPDSKVMFDEPRPRQAMKPCVSRKTSYSCTPTYFTQNVPNQGTYATDGVRCGHPAGDLFWGQNYPQGSASYYFPYTTWCEDPFNEYVLGRKEVQDKLASLITEYYRDLYTISNDLPDMTVFIKELGDFKKLWAMILSAAKSLANLLRSYKGVDDAIKAHAKNSPAGKAITKEHHRNISREIEDLPNKFVGYNFGFAAPLRDICTILTEILAKIQAILPSGETQKRHYRTHPN